MKRDEIRETLAAASARAGGQAYVRSLNPDRVAEVREFLAGYFTAEDSVNQIAVTLMAAWQVAEGKAVSASRVATFADMARSVLDYHANVTPPPGRAPSECRRCGLTTTAANAGVLCEPGYGSGHDFPSGGAA